jgi:putative membrane protein
VVPQPQDFDVPATLAPAPPLARRFPWGTVFWSALGGLVALGSGLAITALIEDLYARATWLGTFGAALAVLAVLSLVVICIRETIGLFRLASIEKLRARAELALAADDRDAARAIVRELTAKLSATPQLARSRGELQAHLTEIIDGRDLLHIAERGLMAPLDQQASRLVARTATRVSLVTAVSPRAVFDIVFVLWESLRLIRGVADFYGGRPGAFGLFRLLQAVLSHLAVTGSIAVGDTLLQQIIGHGVAARLSAKLGEGIVNGLMTARIGLSAIDVCRPLPFLAANRPQLKDLTSDLVMLRDTTAAARPT